MAIFHSFVSQRTVHPWICSVMMIFFVFVHQVLTDDVSNAGEEVSPVFLSNDSSVERIHISANEQSRMLEKWIGDWKISLMDKSGRQEDQVSAAFRRFFHSCSLKHGPVNVETVQISLVQMQTCLEPIFSSSQRRLRFINNNQKRILTTNFMNELLEEDEDVNSLDDVISLFCQRDISKMEGCIRESLSAFKACTDGAGDQDLDIIYSTGRAALEYVCHNNGERIIEFIKKDGSKCLGETFWMDCIFRKRIDPVLKQWELNHSIFSISNCRMIHSESDNCIFQYFEDCIGNDIKRLVRSFMESAMNKTNCFQSPSFSNSVSNSNSYLPSMILSLILGHFFL